VVVLGLATLAIGLLFAVVRLARTKRLLVNLARSEANRASAGERARIARDLHDGLAQELWRARLKLGLLIEHSRLAPEAAALANEAAAALDRGVIDTRQTLTALRVSQDPGELIYKLDRHVQIFDEDRGLRAKLVPIGPLPSLPAATQDHLLRVLDEALTNVVKHAEATVVTVRVACDDGWLRLSITDNGHGFDLERAGARGLGLQTMRERTMSMRGRLDVDTWPREGTAITLSVPIAGDAP
jgi:signal transduction histidine kinase